MKASVHDFSPRIGFFVLSSPGTLLTGERFYELIYHAAEAEGGGCFCTWSGTVYLEGLAATNDWEGVRLTDRIGGAR